jgi:hypothetical protein
MTRPQRPSTVIQGGTKRKRKTHEIRTARIQSDLERLTGRSHRDRSGITSVFILISQSAVKQHTQTRRHDVSSVPLAPRRTRNPKRKYPRQTPLSPFSQPLIVLSPQPAFLSDQPFPLAPSSRRMMIGVMSQAEGIRGVGCESGMSV